MVASEANEPGSESGKRSDDRRGAARGTRAGRWSPQEGGASSHLAARLAPRAPGSLAAAAMGCLDRRLDLPLLAQRLVEDDGHRGGEVEAPYVLARERDAEGGLGVRAADGGGEAAALAPEDEEVVGAEAHRGVRARGVRREAEEPARRAGG